MLRPTPKIHGINGKIADIKSGWAQLSRRSSPALFACIAFVGMVLFLLFLIAHSWPPSPLSGGDLSDGPASLSGSGTKSSGRGLAYYFGAVMGGGQENESGTNTSSDKVPYLVDLAPPLSRRTLGHATWSMLHTMAALFPEKPTAAQQGAMRMFLRSLGTLYPCGTCAKHFRQFMIRRKIPHPLTRQKLAEWMCEAHNAVNQRLEKPMQNCNYENLKKKWPEKLDESCGCSDKDEDDDEKDSKKQSKEQDTTNKDGPAASLTVDNSDAAGLIQSQSHLSTDADSLLTTPRSVDPLSASNSAQA